MKQIEISYAFTTYYGCLSILKIDNILSTYWLVAITILQQKINKFKYYSTVIILLFKEIYETCK